MMLKCKIKYKISIASIILLSQIFVCGGNPPVFKDISSLKRLCSLAQERKFLSGALKP